MRQNPQVSLKEASLSISLQPGIHSAYEMGMNLCECGFFFFFSDFVFEPRLAKLAQRHAGALFDYAISGDVRRLLVPQRPLMAAQDENGDTCVSHIPHTQQPLHDSKQVFIFLPFLHVK